MLAGLVLEGSRRIDKAGESVRADAELSVRSRSRFVVRGVVCLDAGCSTGGFTDCLLQRGAARVYAVDVGYGQFAWSLRTDTRVVLMERTNVRAVDPASLDPRPTLVVADLSFVSLGSILPSLVALAVPQDAQFVLLVKPQFEVAAAETERGVVVSADVRARALVKAQAAVRRCGLEVRGTTESPIKGAEGNVEYLLHARC